MKNKIVVWMVAFVIASVPFLFVGLTGSSGEIVREFQEYSIEIVEDIPYFDEKEEIEILLNEKGQLNWRLISFSKEQNQISGMNYYLIFERSITLVRTEEE